jgi:excisionase family DNA binding protein
MNTAKKQRPSRTRSVEALAEVEDGVERLLRREVVAERLGCDPATVRRMVKEKRFPAPLMIGKMPRWREADVNLWIARESRKVDES